MIIKTRTSLAEKVRAAVKEMHSYTTPAILVVPLESVDPDYHAWIEAETEEQQRRSDLAPSCPLDCFVSLAMMD
jgi:hypothetical protein